MRFPEFSIALAQQGAEILTYPSAFTVPTGMDHWHVIAFFFTLQRLIPFFHRM
jgi:predicted amidohydrolase